MNAPFPHPLGGSGNGAPDLEVAIIGAGFSGLGMAIKLKERGETRFRVFEKGDEVGGTWRENRYPGCACDVPSHLYSYSFEPNPNWSRAFSPQPEILDYLRRTADKYGVREFVRFGTAVREAAFDEGSGFWHVTTDKGETVTARAVVAGVGALSLPLYPDIPGLEDFEGDKFHSAEWPAEDGLDGKRVAVIGTGASAIQFVPQIAPRVSKLNLFQRTPPWIVPKLDGEFTEAQKQRFAKLPLWRRVKRAFIYTMLELRALGFTVNPKLMSRMQKIAERHLEEQVPDPDLRAKLTPDYVMGCKRVLLSNDYYPALMRDNVDLVTDPIERVTARGVVTADGTLYEADSIVYGTGFRATEPLSNMTVRGRGGRDLNADWKAGAEAYLGITVSGYPNLFLLMGPNTGLGHNSMIFMIEAQIHYALESLALLAEKGADFMDVKSEAHKGFIDEVQERIKKTVWSTGCRSWYQQADGRNTTLWPGFTAEYWMRTRHPKEAHYSFEQARPVEAKAAAE